MKIFKKILKFLHIVYFADHARIAELDYYAAILKWWKKRIMSVWQERSKMEVTSVVRPGEILEAFCNSPRNSEARKMGLVRVVEEVPAKNLLKFLYQERYDNSWASRNYDPTEEEFVSIENKLALYFFNSFIEKVTSNEISTVDEAYSFFKEKGIYSSWFNNFPSTEKYDLTVSEQITKFRQQETGTAITFKEKLEKINKFSKTPEGESLIRPAIKMIKSYKMVISFENALSNWSLPEIEKELHKMKLNYLDTEDSILSFLKRAKNGSDEEKLLLEKLKKLYQDKTE